MGNTDAQKALAQPPALNAITGDYIAEQARITNEPAWLIDWRVKAWEVFVQSIPPLWKRTRLTALDAETIAPVFKPQGTAIQWDPALEATGVVFTTLQAALHSHGDLIRSYMGTGVDPLSHKFSALRAALWQDGAFLYVPRNTDIEIPLEVHYTLLDSSRSIFPYTLVILERNARVTLIEQYTSRDMSEPALVGSTNELFVGAGSEMRYINIQNQGHGVHQIGGQVMNLERDAGGEWVSIALGSQVQHIEAEARMQGDGSRITWRGATFGSDEQNLVMVPWLRHIGSNTESHLEFKTVVTDKAYSVFDGMIKIEHESQATTTRLEEHSIHLSPQARNDSIPGLKIDTNDVAQAGHASTSGQVDAEQLFYMQARGIKPVDAKRLIVMGFFESTLNAIPLEHVREALSGVIEAKI